MRVLIRSNWSERIRELYEVCSPNHVAYCKRWGYDYVAGELDYQNYNKVTLIDMMGLSQNLVDYDVVMTIGMDTLFMNHDISIGDVMTDSDAVVIARGDPAYSP